MTGVRSNKCHRVVVSHTKLASITTDLLAVIRFHFASFHSFRAAIATVVRTTFIVVHVVAIAVALVLGKFA